MAQTKILIDTNSYIRLARTIHPLLFQPFGEDEYCLYVLPELNKELAIELEVPVVTDDQDMIGLAHVFDVKTMPTLALLRIMLDCEHINKKKIQALFEHWRHITDLPANFAADSLRWFSDL